MPPNRILVDSSYLFTLFAEKDDRHQDAIAIARIYQGQFIIPYVILTEVAYLFNREGGIPAVILFLDKLTRMQPIFEITASDDLTRAREIMAEYRDARLDFVDCCIMALSERLNITQVCTFDQRDFGIFRPLHCDYLEILP